MGAWKLIGLAAALAAPGVANAARMFNLTYTTSVDPTSGPAVTLHATVTTDDGEFYGPGGFLVTGISGTRAGQAISFVDNLDEIFFPARSDGYFLDNFGVSYTAGESTYQIYHQDGFFAYQEFASTSGGNTGRIVENANFSLTPLQVAAVPEPASWAMMIGGFGMVGGAMRRRNKIARTVKFA